MILSVKDARRTAFDAARQAMVEAMLLPDAGTEAGVKRAAVAFERAYVTSLTHSGYAIVPRDPTLDMQRKYFETIDANMKRVETDATFGRFSNNALAMRFVLAGAHADYMAAGDYAVE